MIHDDKDAQLTALAHQSTAGNHQEALLELLDTIDRIVDEATMIVEILEREANSISEIKVGQE
jgi:hypothetical protein